MTKYKVNPYGVYALYYNGSAWKESGSKKNSDLESA